jgi:hypothetical protein
VSGGSDWGPGSVGGGPPGASPESSGALDGRRERDNRPEEHPAPRPGCLRTLIAIALVLAGLALAWYLFIVLVDVLG